MEDLVKTICDELTLCYESAGRKSPESLMVVAVSHAEAIDFKDGNHVHEAFKRARDIEPIPTQKTLKECARNYSEEVIKYDVAGDIYPRVEYQSPVSPWLPKDYVMRKVNDREAIKRFCIASSDRMYYEYCHIHSTNVTKLGAEKRVAWQMPDKVKEFDDRIRARLAPLYQSYIRMTPVYRNFPQDYRVTTEMLPPSVRELKIMLNEESKRG